MLGEAVLAGAALAWSVTSAPVDATPRTTTGFRVRIARPGLASAVQDALVGASRRLGRPGCSAVFGDFNDESGRTLQSNLDALGRTAPDYLELIAFHDGQGVARCERGGIMAITSPGSRVVWVCGSFALAQKRDPGLGEALLLHEVLHSLGLAENPPSSREITNRVVMRCGR